MKGMILAGGSGSRLWPLTLVVNKHLLAIADKPMVYYPLSVLMLAGIRDILIITTPADVSLYQQLLGDGRRWGMSFSFAAQPKPEGLAQAYIIGEAFLAGEPSMMILGDNIFYGHSMTQTLREAATLTYGAKVFAYHVEHPERFGVVTFHPDGSLHELIEKPTTPVSHWALVGLYVFDGHVAKDARLLKPSDRNELEITDLMREYHMRHELAVDKLGRGIAWLDTGTPESLVDASMFIETIQRQQGQEVACPEEIAWQNGWIDDSQLLQLADALGKSRYGQYLRTLPP